MRTDDWQTSENIEDRRDDSGGGGFGMPMGAGGLGIGGLVVLGLIGWALGISAPMRSVSPIEIRACSTASFNSGATSL